MHSNADLLNQLLSAFVLFAVAVLPVAAVYMIALLRALIRHTNGRSVINAQRDAQRDEIQENVRRLVGGHGVRHDPNTGPADAVPAPKPQHRRRAPRPPREHTTGVVSITTDDAAPTERHNGPKDGI